MQVKTLETHFRIASAITLVCALCASHVRAVNLMEDHFAYTVGDLDGQGGWTNRNSTTPFTQVVAGSLSYPGLPGIAGEKIQQDLDINNGVQKNHTAVTLADGESIYLSFLVNVQDAPTATNGVDLAQFRAGTNGAARVVVREADASNFRLGARCYNSTAANSTWGTTSLPYNTVIHVVLSYDRIAGTANDRASVWVNPPLGSSTPPAAYVTDFPTDTEIGSATSFNLIFLGPDQDVTGGPFWAQWDEVRISKTWSDVVVPVTLSSFAVE